MPISKLRPAFTFTEDRLRELQAVVPEAFADGKINWETLREALGDILEDESQEHFGLFWPGKREARRLAAMPSKGTLIPQLGEGVDEENTHNLFIEGDNLEVLKLLQKSYAGRVKMIYIDPPYNTGNDFVYPDDYSEPLESYLERTGQANEEGQLLTTNSRASGRFHSNWLNMIYPRLLLARHILREDGVIFISIDNNEMHNLRQVMNEIFGEENFVGIFIWRKKEGGGQTDEFFVTEHEYVLVYRRSSLFTWVDETIEVESGKSNRVDKDGRSYDLVKLAKWGTGAKREDRPTMYFPLKSPNGKTVFPIAPDGNDGRWRVGKKRMEYITENDLIHWELKGTQWVPYEKIYRDGTSTKTIKDRSILFDETNTAEGTNVLTEIFGTKDVFDNPKPPALIKHFLRNNTSADDLILDFFAGSCATAHAIFQQNQEDDGQRRFIMIQIPEPTNEGSPSFRLGLETIADIGKERIRRVISKVKKSQSKQKSKLQADLGFQVLSLSPSSFFEWEPFTGKDSTQLELRFVQAETPLVEGWKPENLLTEILLLQGFPLDSKLRSLSEFKANEVQQVTSEFVGHHLYICLDKKVKAETVAKINLRSEDILVCLDSALSDEAKVKLADQCNLKVI